MKQLKLMLLMAFFSLGFASVSFGQDPIGGGGTPASKYTVTRNACLPGYSGCYSGAVTLRLDNGGSPSLGGSYTFSGITESHDYPTYGSKIKVTIGSLTSIGTYSLPTVIGDQVIITSGLDDGAHHAYTVGITKTADKQFTLSIGDFAY
ncbi:hypothetical protein F0919_04495 [Taibaiella lutea]|uniref:Uncharacterized protein n=1 Tax=Taibaiella lutea TaxID=2608001 RepID=A0A5M6CNY3_9BACT|nr:hypothetical protein [Taibaiella lutea]KAA5536938.1 hypothetical protein F0919_04495 [Taibaiella lutea]